MRRIDISTGAIGAVDVREEEVERLKSSAKALTSGLIDAVKNGGATAVFLGRPPATLEESAGSETKQALTLLTEALENLGVRGSVAAQFAGALEALATPKVAANEEPSVRPLVFGFGDAAQIPESPAERKKLLGGKGAELMKMSELGMPIPPAFTITTEACASYLASKAWPEGLAEGVLAGVRQLEEQTGKRLGDAENPLLVSVRSGAAVSMPGMMDTILNLGLNDEVCRGLAKATGNERFAYDAYRRFISMFGNVAMGVKYEHFEEALEAIKKDRGVKLDVELNAEDLKELVSRYQAIYREHTGSDFPSDPQEQLRLSIGAVFDSWNNDRAITYREINEITGLMGTGVNVQAMVFGNMGEASGTGVCFTRNPGTGARELFGEFLTNAQGEDVVAGIRTPMPISQMEQKFPAAYRQLLELCSTLEGHYHHMQDIEFTVENGNLFILQTRNGKRNGEAAVKIAVDLVREGVTDPKTAVLQMVEAAHVAQMLRPRFAENGEAAVKLASGIAASPGAAVGQAVFTVADAIALSKQGTPVILVRNDTSPEDVGGMDAAQGVLTRTGGKTSHAAVVARGWGKPCVTGCGDLEVDEKAKRFTTADGTVVKHGDWISLNGSTGEVVLGKRQLVQPEPNGDLATLMQWVDSIRTTQVRVNAESAAEIQRAMAFGADGIGLSRTDHMFFSGKNLRHTQQMILSTTEAERKEALAKQHDSWKAEFETLLGAMHGAPVTIRLMSATMDKFLPENDKMLRRLADDLGVPFELAKARRDDLKQIDPSLGLKGCRLTFEYPEITEAQTRAILEAALDLQERGIRVVPEIMVPMVGTAGEFLHQKKIIQKTAAEVFAQRGAQVEFEVGCTVETPRAALVAGELARVADFLSIDTDALTQLTFGMSRGSGSLIDAYVARDILKDDPFTAFDQQGVGKLVELAVKQAREAAPETSVRVAGGHTRDTGAVEFAVGNAGVDGVSTSWREVPVAKLIAVKAEQSPPA